MLHLQVQVGLLLIVLASCAAVVIIAVDCELANVMMNEVRMEMHSIHVYLNRFECEPQL